LETRERRDSHLCFPQFSLDRVKIRGNLSGLLDERDIDEEEKEEENESHHSHKEDGPLLFL